jgi:hypothetical protein
MRPEAAKSMISASEALRSELVLRLPDGGAWVLSVSPGIERFIGFYPRLDGIDAGGPLLEFRTVHAA